MDIAREARPASVGGFLGEALGALRDRRIVVPAVLLLLVLTFSNIVILLNLPTVKGAVPSVPFLAAAFVRLAGLLILAIGILRILTASERPAWRPDAGFWLYLLTFAVGAGISVVVRRLVGDGTDVTSLLLSNVIVTVLLAPLIVWFVAIAVAKPLALNPRPWVRDFGRWLPPLLLWTLLLVTPMAVLHAVIDVSLIEGVGGSFWPLALFDGALSTVMAIVGLALNAAAYRRVASR